MTIYRDVLMNGEILKPGDMLVSLNDIHRLIFKNDGNLCLVTPLGTVWQTSTADTGANQLMMQGDGNLVLSAGMTPLWASNTNAGDKAFLNMQVGANLCVYREIDHPVWQTGTLTPGEWWRTKTIEYSHETRDILRQNEQWSNLRASVTAGTGNIIAPDAVITVCSSPPAGPLICVAAIIVIAVILEIKHGDPAFGPNNDIRVAGRNINSSLLTAGKDIANWYKDSANGAGNSIHNFFRDPTTAIHRKWRRIFG